MIDLSPGALVMLAGALTVLAGIALGILSESRHTGRPDMTRMHYRPDETFLRYVSGVDAGAVRRAAKRAKPVVPPESPYSQPYDYRKN